MNTTHYTHITKEERKEIAHFLKKDYSQNDIAQLLGRSKSSISAEVRNNSVKGVYDPEKAQVKAQLRRRNSKYQGMKVATNPTLRAYVEDRIKADWSPELIAGRLKYIRTDLPSAGKKAIYKFIHHHPLGYGLEQYLWRTRKKPRGTSRRAGKEKLANRTFIDERPNVVETRGRYGDLEGDLMVSGRDGTGVLVVLHERKSRYVIIRRVLSRETRAINDAFYGMTGGILCCESLTLDNDISFQKHEELSQQIGVSVFFCHPYASWEKGGVENTIGLIRCYIPKGSDISCYSEEDIADIQEKLNNRPRKCLGFKTPHEVLHENNLLAEEVEEMSKKSLVYS